MDRANGNILFQYVYFYTHTCTLSFWCFLNYTYIVRHQNENIVLQISVQIFLSQQLIISQSENAQKERKKGTNIRNIGFRDRSTRCISEIVSWTIFMHFFVITSSSVLSSFCWRFFHSWGEQEGRTSSWDDQVVKSCRRIAELLFSSILYEDDNGPGVGVEKEREREELEWNSRGNASGRNPVSMKENPEFPDYLLVLFVLLPSGTSLHGLRVSFPFDNHAHSAFPSGAL